MRGGRLRILTLNCLFYGHARARLRVIGRLIKEVGADVACLQEVFLRRNASVLDADRAVFQPWGPFVKGGLVSLTDAPLASREFEVYRTGLWFEWGARKGLLTVRTRVGDCPITIINTHLLANYDEDWALDNRYARKQLDELRQLAEAVNRVPGDRLVIVAGDFNVPLVSAQFAEFMSSCGLQAAFDWANVKSDERGGLAIDNVLYRAPRGVEVRASAASCFHDPVLLPGGRSVYPSDHLGVLAQLEW